MHKAKTRHSFRCLNSKRVLIALGSATLLTVLSGILFPTRAQAEWNEVNKLTQEIGTLNTSCSYRVKFSYQSAQNSYKLFKYLYPVSHTQKDLFDTALNIPATLDVLAFQLSFYDIENFLGQGSQRFGRLMDAYQNSPAGANLSLELSIGAAENSASTYNRDRFQVKLLNYASSIRRMTTTALESPSDLEGYTLEENCPVAADPQIVGGLASTTLSSMYEVNNSIDGRKDTFWVGGVGASVYTLEFELDEVYALGNLSIDWYSSYFASSDFDVFVSRDGLAYSQVASNLEGASSVKLNGVEGSWIRIVMHKLNNPYYPVIREIGLTRK